MRFIRLVAIIIFLCIVGYIYITEWTGLEGNFTHSPNINSNQKEIPPEHLVKSENPIIIDQLESDYLEWIGHASEELLEILGEPTWKDMSAYGGDLWIYTDEKTKYLQFGIYNNKVETVYIMLEELPLIRNIAGYSYEEIANHYQFQSKVLFDKDVSSYEFHLTEEDLKMRPLIKVNDSVFIQFQFDTITERMTSFRIITDELLLKYRPYELQYTGTLPPTESLTGKEWEEVDRGMERQIFAMTNVIRAKFQKQPLIWQTDIQQVAIEHSEDMAKNDYFSHESLNGNGLKERLSKGDVFYRMAGENIAAHYIDAPAVMIGWLNSDGHRETLLEEEFTHLGVGVYQLYFTQNFISKQ